MSRGAVHHDGVRIAYREAGPADGVAILVLHGFTGTGASMGPAVAGLATTHRVVSPDLVGHGASDAPEAVEAYNTEVVVGQLAGVLDHLGVEAAHVVGYSLGGRLGLSLAAAHAHRVLRLVLIGTTAGIEDPGERARRGAADEALADSIETEGMEAFVDRWERSPIFGTQHELPTEVRESLRATRLAQRPVGLANALRGCGAGAMPPLWDRIRDLNRPVRLVVGELDTDYVRLGRRLVEVLPNAELCVVPGVGHAVHLEAPAACAELVAGHLAA